MVTVPGTGAVVYHSAFHLPLTEPRFPMLEVNAISRQIKDMQGRLDALRGYL